MKRSLMSITMLVVSISIMAMFLFGSVVKAYMDYEEGSGQQVLAQNNPEADEAK